MTVTYLLAFFVDGAIGGWITETFKKRLREVCPVFEVRLDDFAADRSVPAVVAQCRQERLVYGTANILLMKRIHIQHIHERVRLSLDPEAIALCDVSSNLVRLRLARIRNDVIIIWASNGSLVFVEVADEEVVPGLVAVVLRGGVTFEQFFELVGRLSNVSCDSKVVHAVVAEPADLVVFQDIC
jgi:hypothetical protein